MKAVLKLAPADGALSVADLAEPTPRPGEALLRIAAAGICGTDVAIWHWYEAVVGQYAPSFPLIIGHEFGGHVVHDTPRFPAGTLAAVNPQIACRRCYYCNLGRPTLCIDRRFMGGKIDGGWTEFACLPEDNLYAFPDGTDPALSCLAEPLCVATHAVIERVPPAPGDTVAVIGAGPIGLLCLVLALHAGARNVFITGVGADHARLALAERLGGIPIDVEAQDPGPIIRAAQWDGADVVYETSGSAAVLAQAAGLARRGGRIGLIGLCHGESRLVTTPLVLRELELIGSRGYNDTTWAAMMRVLPAISAELLSLISHRLPLDRAEDALRLVESRAGTKVLLTP